MARTKQSEHIAVQEVAMMEVVSEDFNMQPIFDSFGFI